MKDREQSEKENSWFAEELERERRESVRNFDGNKEQKERSSTSDPFFVIDLILFILLLPFSL